jgi:hypothetical protein
MVDGLNEAAGKASAEKPNGADEPAGGRRVLSSEKMRARGVRIRKTGNRKQ